MWLDNLKDLRKQMGNPSNKWISEQTNLPERTIARIFSGDTDNPYTDTLHRIVKVLDGSLDDILADSKAVVATETVVELKENADAITAQKDLIVVENDMLKKKVEALSTELELLKKELAHKDEIIALHNYYKTHFEQLVKRGGIT